MVTNYKSRLFYTHGLRQLINYSDGSNLDILGMDSRLLKIGASAITPSLCNIFNMSIRSGDLPQDWKCAKITPIYKGKGSLNECGNYRPISVISHVAKVIEKAVLLQLKDYLTSHDFFSNCQSAFIKHHSTTTAVHKVNFRYLR